VGILQFLRGEREAAPTAAKVVDTLIEKGVLLKEYRTLAIAELDMELRRHIRDIAGRVGRVAGMALRMTS